MFYSLQKPAVKNNFREEWKFPDFSIDQTNKNGVRIWGPRNAVIWTNREDQFFDFLCRASMVLSCQVQDPSFSDTLLTANPSLELISKLAGECNPGQRLIVLETHCQQLRKLFKDFVKPSELPKKITKTRKKIVLDGSRTFPPVRGCVFTEGHTCVQFMADPAAGHGLPRGTFLYASAPLPHKVSSLGFQKLRNRLI